MKFSEAVKLLCDGGVENPAFDAAMLFEHFSGVSRVGISARDPDCQSPDLEEAVKKRAQREPLQYIIGTVGFYREEYEVSGDCLIPRSDTEILVDYAVKHIPSGSQFLDLCTGSGCIAVSTLKNTASTTAKALDISEGALALARRNSQKNGVSDRIEFLKGDVLTKAVGGKYSAILSNPPYVTEEEYKSLEPELYYEPKCALVSGESGIEFYERILALYCKSLSEGGFFAFEIGSTQGNDLCRLGESCGMESEILKDYSGNDRVVVMRKK